jgi:hypothetical protein
VWPEIRVPPGVDREAELRLDVDRWTYLHPQLMTLAELNQHIGNLMKLGERYLRDLLELRQRKPVAFCSLLCSIFMFTAFIGNQLSGLCLVFTTLIIIMTAPGIYVHLLPEPMKQWLYENIGRSLSMAPHETSAPEEKLLEPHKISPSELTSNLGSKISSTTKSIEQLFETLKQKSFPLIQAEQQVTSRLSSPSTSSTVATQPEQPNNDGEDRSVDERTKLIDIPLSKAGDRFVKSRNLDDDCADIRHGQSNANRRRSSDSSNGNDESVSLIESDDDQQDGFVML